MNSTFHMEWTFLIRTIQIPNSRSHFPKSGGYYNGKHGLNLERDVRDEHNGSDGQVSTNLLAVLLVPCLKWEYIFVTKGIFFQLEAGDIRANSW